MQRRIIAVPASVAKASGAPDMPLLHPSFRGRLRLFFAVIVIVPIIAVGFVLFRLIDTADDSRADSGLNTAQRVARNLYVDHRRAAAPAIDAIRRTWRSRRRSSATSR